MSPDVVGHPSPSSGDPTEDASTTPWTPVDTELAESTRTQAVKRARRRARLKRWPVQAAILLGILFGWELASGTMIDYYFVGSPTDVLARFGQWISDGTLLTHGSSTIQSAIIGYAVGGLAALLCGYALGVSDYWSSVLEPFITALWGLPRIALIPLLVIWVGFGQSLAITVAAIVSFFLLFFNTYYGVREVSHGLIDSMRIMGATRMTIAWSVRIPSALVWIAAGIKLSVPMALVGVVTAEMIASNVGLGHLVRLSGNSFDIIGTITAITALLVVGVAFERFSSLLSRRALRWNTAGSE